METNIHGELRPVRDFELSETMEWNDAIDSDNQYHFTVNTKRLFMAHMEFRFKCGEGFIIVIDGQSKGPMIITDKASLTREDFETASKVYRQWEKEWNKN